jgi:hypothetical protein
MNNQFVQVVKFLAQKLRREIGFVKPISLQLFLIIRLFGFIPHNFTISTEKQYNAMKITILNRVIHHHLYEAGYRNLKMHKWWNNSLLLHRHFFLEAISSYGFYKPWTFELLYSTTIHGFSNNRFHELCDNQGPTMIVMTLNGKIVVAFVEKSWNTQNVWKFGYQEDKSCNMFHLTSTGEIVTLQCSGFNNYLSSGPDFKFLHVNLDKKEASSSFPVNNRQITCSINSSFVTVDSVIVLKLSISFKSFPKTLLTKIASAVAPYLSIGR